MTDILKSVIVWHKQWESLTNGNTRWWETSVLLTWRIFRIEEEKNSQTFGKCQMQERVVISIRASAPQPWLCRTGFQNVKQVFPTLLGGVSPLPCYVAWQNRKVLARYYARESYPPTVQKNTKHVLASQSFLWSGLFFHLGALCVAVVFISGFSYPTSLLAYAYPTCVHYLMGFHEMQCGANAGVMRTLCPVNLAILTPQHVDAKVAASYS